MAAGQCHSVVLSTMQRLVRWKSVSRSNRKASGQWSDDLATDDSKTEPSKVIWVNSTYLGGILAGSNPAVYQSAQNLHSAIYSGYPTKRWAG